MKQIWPNYSYSPTTNVLTLTGLNIDRDQLLLVSAPERGRIMYNFADSSVTASAFTAGANTGLTLVASTAGLTTTAALVIYYDDQVGGISGTVTAMAGTNFSDEISEGILNFQYNSGGFNINSIPAISSVAGSGETPNYAVQIGYDTGSDNFAFVSPSQGLPISGTVTIGSALPAGTNRIGVVTIGAGTVTIGAGTAQIGSVTASISGTVPVSISSVTVGNSVTIGSLPAISGTVTANSSNGSLTTRFGSVTTANTAFATSAVTNANRKYLLIQNITTASNVITVGIGFTPTTTQGIQLSSGAGLTFESSYIPTGAVNLLSSVTASCFTILEA